MTAVHFTCSAPTDDVHPEALPEHRIARSCEAVHGYPQCMGAAGFGPERCTCEMLTPEQHALCLRDAWEAYNARGGEPCDDCAFRKGSPESDDLDRIAAQEKPFYCHKGAPVDARGGFPAKDAYVPGRRFTEYPVCPGWQRAHAALARRAP